MSYTGRAKWLKKKGYKYIGESDSELKSKKTVKAYRRDGSPSQYVKYNDDLGYPYFEVYIKNKKR